VTADNEFAWCRHSCEVGVVLPDERTSPEQFNVFRRITPAMLYGEPRLTHDVDFVVFLRKDDLGRLQKVFAAPARAQTREQMPTSCVTAQGPLNS
jgi:hypothetical protein